jgi:hypothetical protein
MRAALRLLILIWATVSVASLFGLGYVFPGYSIDSAFSAEAPKRPRVVLVSLVSDFLSGRYLRDGMAVPYTPQALRQPVEKIKTHYLSFS